MAEDFYRTNGLKTARRIVGVEVVVVIMSIIATFKHFKAAGGEIGPVAWCQLIHAIFAVSEVVLSMVIILTWEENECFRYGMVSSFERLSLMLFVFMWYSFVRYWDTCFSSERIAAIFDKVRVAVLVGAAYFS